MKKPTKYLPIYPQSQASYVATLEKAILLKDTFLRSIVFLLLLFPTLNMNGQTTFTFEGTWSQNWTDLLNWSPVTTVLPGPNDHVIIDPSGPFQNVILNENTTIRSLEVASGSLTLNSGNSLSVSGTPAGSAGVTVGVNGQLFIDGILNIDGTVEEGLFNYGTTTNTGSIYIGDDSPIGTDGIQNEGTFVNENFMDIRNVGQRGILNGGSATIF